MFLSWISGRTYTWSLKIIDLETIDDHVPKVYIWWVPDVWKRWPWQEVTLGCIQSNGRFEVHFEARKCGCDLEPQPHRSYGTLPAELGDSLMESHDVESTHGWSENGEKSKSPKYSRTKESTLLNHSTRVVGAARFPFEYRKFAVWI